MTIKHIEYRFVRYFYQQLLDNFTNPNDIVLFLNEYFNCLDFAKQALKDIWEGTEIE